MNKKTIFLDVDGVLNRRGTRERGPHSTYGVDCSLVPLFRKLIEATDAQIVLSSTWRLYPEMVTYLWRQLGEDIKARCVGMTIELWDEERGHEIQKWLDGHPEVTQFVILDDTPDMAHLMPHLIQTDSNVGLSEEDVAEAIRRLT